MLLQDFLLDEAGRTWLLEINSMPKLKTDNGDPWFNDLVAELSADLVLA